MNDVRKTGKKYAEFLESLSENERKQYSEQNIENSKREHQEFRKAFRGRHCYLCNKSLSSFYPDTPCLHWLLNPSGFKKNYLPSVAEKYGFLQMQSYLRWVANEKAFARNINDLKEEGSGKLFESTIKYKDLEWSFSCSEDDYLGHQKTKHSYPHYHLQMRINGKPIIKYNDFHLPMNDYDIHNIEAMKKIPHIMKGYFAYGEGMSDLLVDDNIEDIINSSLSTDEKKGAAFKFDTLIMADEGSTISGEDLYEIIEEAKKENKTIASVAHKIPNATARTFVSPGPDVVQQYIRSSRRKKI